MKLYLQKQVVGWLDLQATVYWTLHKLIDTKIDSCQEPKYDWALEGQKKKKEKGLWKT